MNDDTSGTNFLPVDIEGIKEKGWNYIDVLLISGDAYVDHPSFGVALIGRLLENMGLKVAILSQPDINSDEILSFGRPRYFIGITGGNVDSMVANYTASKKRRRTDAYTPGYINNRRPDRATIVYSNYVKRFYKDVPLVLGGIEASLRRMAHYDWWQDKVRHSILLDSKADFLIYGMAERTLRDFVSIIKRKHTFEQLSSIPGLVFTTSDKSLIDKDAIEIPSFENVASDKKAYSDAFNTFYSESDCITGHQLYQKDGKRFVVQNKPSKFLSTEEMDEIYKLPFTKKVHPKCLEKGEVKALDTVLTSITSHRGCYGECNFCAIALHQGRYISSRSENSIMEEVNNLKKTSKFKGYISDIGGPTANMYGFDCSKKTEFGACKNKRCLFPNVCKSLKPDHSKYLMLLRKVLNIKGIKGVFISSGIRPDLVFADSKFGDKFLAQVAKYHVSGQLKLAPEHLSKNVTDVMGKPDAEQFFKFKNCFLAESEKINKKQFVIGYFIVAHPGETREDNEYLKRNILSKLGFVPQQIQIFTPTPSTISTTMWYTKINPLNNKSMEVITSEKKRKEYKENILFSREVERNGFNESTGKRKKRKRFNNERSRNTGKPKRR